MKTLFLLLALTSPVKAELDITPAPKTEAPVCSPFCGEPMKVTEAWSVNVYWSTTEGKWKAVLAVIV